MSILYLRPTLDAYTEMFKKPLVENFSEIKISIKKPKEEKHADLQDQTIPQSRDMNFPEDQNIQDRQSTQEI